MDMGVALAPVILLVLGIILAPVAIALAVLALAIVLVAALSPLLIIALVVFLIVRVNKKKKIAKAVEAAEISEDAEE